MNETNKIICKMIYSKLKGKVKNNGKIRIKDINCILGMVFHIPKEHRIKILEEMERLKLLKLKKKTRVELNEIEIG